MKILISHSSKNKSYGNELVNLLTGIGVNGDEIIFTSNDAYGIPIGHNIFDWLKNRITEKPHVIYLLSPEYYKSIACLNEMGAAWVVESKHTMIFTPAFNLNSPEFLNGAIDPREIGFFIDNHDKLIAFIESLRVDYSISSNQVLINQKIRVFLENIKSFKPLEQNTSEVLTSTISNKVLINKEVEKNEPNGQVTPLKDKSIPNSENSRLLSDLKNNKLKDEDVLLIYYIIETGRFKLGTGWRESQEVENIKVWEDVQELNSTLSTNYDKALKRFDMKNITEVSQTTTHGNPREISLTESVQHELLTIPDDLLVKINEVVIRNNKTDNW